ncbi:MAG: DUF5916 domain-containing protein [Saprospiraceae bacterium]|nr:carbohydrate binding family 9 domain-containing protein [Candidatus Vicinibacter proximus]MCC6843384.1 carbohydrate binding family 9 domain-containing protein [Saprospiraceae bacterium]
MLQPRKPSFFSLVLIICFQWSTLQALDKPKLFQAVRIYQPISIDGRLVEKEWSFSDTAEGFFQTEPLVGKPASFETKVYCLYDDYAVYFGARLFDPEPDKILKELCLRDNSSNSDLFKVFIDSYRSGLNGFLFAVNAAGVQADYIVSNNEEDSEWDVIWDSEIQIDQNGWTIEIKIPYSSLRFPKSSIQEWNVQFGREIRRFRETSYWNPIDPLISGWVQQSGVLNHLDGIKSPVRLSITPYLSAYLNSDYQPEAASVRFILDPAYSMGADLKYGINDAFTLDMTLVPDFGQVIADRRVLNLSPFEIFFNENRQFFTEGTELFNKESLFYSRRVGGQPFNYFKVYDELSPTDVLVRNPSISQLYNATKISGRTKKGMGIGFFNAVESEEYAIIKNERGEERKFLTNPLTNYNVFVLDRNLKNNSVVSVTNTNVLRNGSEYDANVTGGSFELKTKNQKYSAKGRGVLSQKYFSDSIDLGFSSSYEFSKISGNWTYSLGQVIESANYDPNDLGFLFSPNENSILASVDHTQYKTADSKLQQVNVSGSSRYTSLYEPFVFSDFYLDLSTFILWKSRNAIGVNIRLEPIVTRDYFEPRTADFSKYLAWPVNYTFGGFFSSDYRKAFALDVNGSFRFFDAQGRSNYDFNFSPRMRFNDHFSLFADWGVNRNLKELGYVNKNFADQPVPEIQTEDILMGYRNRWIVDNSLGSRYIFNNKMGINLSIRHYWDQVIYHNFGILREDGNVQIIGYQGLDKTNKPIFDQNVNIFNIDLQYTWRFAPGSDIIIVWKNQIFKQDDAFNYRYFRNVFNLIDAPQSNSISVRIIYFMDYLKMFTQRKKTNPFKTEIN